MVQQTNFNKLTGLFKLLCEFNIFERAVRNQMGGYVLLLIGKRAVVRHNVKFDSLKQRSVELNQK